MKVDFEFNPYVTQYANHNKMRDRNGHFARNA